MGFDFYDIPDPDEEERKRQAALSALASGDQGSFDLEHELLREQPVQIPEQAHQSPEPLPDRAPEEMSEPEPLDALRGLAEARPGRGPSDAERSPTANELPSKDGQPAPAHGQVHDEPPPQQDPFEARERRGEADRQARLAEMGEEPSVNGWALLADAVFNRGKSIPQMLQQVDADKRGWRNDRARILTERSRGAGGDPFAARRLQLQERGLGLEQARLDQSAARTTRLANEFDSDKSALISEYAQLGVPEEKLKPLREAGSIKAFTQVKAALDREYRHANRERLAEIPAVERAATEQAEIDTRHSNIDTVAGDAGRIAGSQAAGAAPHQVQTAAAKAEYVTPAETRREGREVARDKRQAERDRVADAERERRTAREGEQDKVQWLDNFGKRTEKFRPMALPLARLAEDTRAGRMEGLGIDNLRKGEAMPAGMTPDVYHGYMAENAKDPAEREYHQRALQHSTDYKFLADYVLRKETGAAANLTEVQRNQIKTGSSPYATKAQIKTAIDIMDGLVLSEYQTAGGSRPDWARESMERARLSPDHWGFQGASPPSAATTDTGLDAVRPPPRATRGNRPPSADGGNLGTTSGVKRIPINKPQDDLDEWSQYEVR